MLPKEIIPRGCIAKGKTILCPFKLETTVPIIDHPEAFGYEADLHYITPTEFMKLAQRTAFRGDEMSWPIDKYINFYKEFGLVDKYADIMLKGEKFPALFIEFEKGLPTEHEGRHRAMAAEKIGVEKVPVYFLKKKDI